MKPIRNRRILQTGFGSVLVVLAVAPAGQVSASAATSSGTPTQATRCAWNVDQLPRTPDAIEGWYHACDRPAVPGTPDAVEAWTR
jgi:hypothetical protein